MRGLFPILTVMAAVAFSAPAFAQTTRPAGGAKDYSNSLIVTRMMRFDARHDGRLTRDEIADDRLLRLFDEADANHDGIVTKEELIAVAAKLEAEVGGDSDGRGGERGPGRPGGPDGGGGFDGPPGFGGPRVFGGPPRPGEVLPPGLQEMLDLTDEQRAEVAKLQKDVDERLAGILTEDQKAQLRNLADRGPGGPRGGGPGGDGPPPGPPPRN
jgi:EF hand domain-containing protein